jgi:hypothetical protein
MEHFLYLSRSAIGIQVLLLLFTVPLVFAGFTLILMGLSRENSGLSGNRFRLVTACLAQGIPSFLVLLYGSMEFHTVPGTGVSQSVAAGFIDSPLLLQIPLGGAWAWWCRRAWPISLGVGLWWGAYSLGAGAMAGMAATGMWL